MWYISSTPSNSAVSRKPLSPIVFWAWYTTGSRFLVPGDHWISRLIIRHFGEFGYLEVGEVPMRGMLRNWSKFEWEIMDDLAQGRLSPLSLPHNTSRDYFASYRISNGRKKRYGVLFTCLNTTAAHVKISAKCTTMEFLQVLWRFERFTSLNDMQQWFSIGWRWTRVTRNDWGFVWQRRCMFTSEWVNGSPSDRYHPIITAKKTVEFRETDCSWLGDRANSRYSL